MADPAVAKCACGKCTLTQRKPGGMALTACHCSHCRAANEKDPGTKGEYGLNSIDWWCNVKTTGPTQGKCTTYAPYGCPCPMWCANRTECAECKTPLVTWGHGGFMGFAIVNHSMVRQAVPAEQAPKPTWEQFYDSGLKKGHQAEKTYYGDVGSTLGMFFNILCLGVPTYGSGHCCCC